MYARERGRARGRRQSAEYLASFFRSLQLSSPPYLLLTAHKTLFVSSSQTMKKRKKTRGKCAPTREVILLFGKKISKIIITFTPSLEGELQISPMNNESVALLFFFSVLMCQSVSQPHSTFRLLNPLNSQTKFVILLTVNHTVLTMLVQRILYWINKLSSN